MRLDIGPHDALIVVDVQNDFVDGSVAIPDAAGVVPVINRLVPLFEHVVFTQDWHPPGHVSFASAHVGMKPGDEIEISYGVQRLYRDHCVQATPGAQLHAGLTVPARALRVHKGLRPDVDSYSAFVENDGETSTGLDLQLRARGIRRVVLTGLALYGCVRHTALDARRAGFEAVIVDDAARARPSPENAAHALALTAAGVLRVRASAFAEPAASTFQASHPE